MEELLNINEVDEEKEESFHDFGLFLFDHECINLGVLEDKLDIP